ncbi:MAG: helix-turn-helix domain-containing protein [Patescibacteria group bacterium]|nr:helix-turn-helix domain-containing protein [Patescibacteria group bacterium]MCL5262208.1 helix-turn-helix domain-containing protein [Patescibacteria group bacterium]
MDNEKYNEKTLAELMEELITGRGLNIDKLAELTNIPKRYLSALCQNDVKSLPAGPYVRGYLNKIAAVTGVEPTGLYAAYKKLGFKTSGKEDALPSNRFAIQKPANRWIIAGALGLLLIIGVSLKIKDVLGIPTINVNLPETDLIVQAPTAIIEGKIDPRDSLQLNGEPIYPDSTGAFSEEVPLEQGINTFEFKIKRFLGRETKIERRIIYEIGEEIQGNETVE